MAIRSKLSEVTISNWKRGSLTFDPKLSTLERLAYGLRLSVADLVSDGDAAAVAAERERVAAAAILDSQAERLKSEAEKLRAAVRKS